MIRPMVDKLIVVANLLNKQQEQFASAALKSTPGFSFAKWIGHRHTMLDGSSVCSLYRMGFLTEASLDENGEFKVRSVIDGALTGPGIALQIDLNRTPTEIAAEIDSILGSL
jgi:hypothetical protein